MTLRLALLVCGSLLLAAPTQSPAQNASQNATPKPSEAMQHAGMHHADKGPAIPSTTLTVQGPAQTATLSLADLEAMPQTTVHVHNAHTKADETYTGPLLAEVLARVGLTLTSKNEHDFLRLSVIASGTDNYFVVYSGAEVQPTLHKADVIVAIAQDGQPLTRTGAFQLIDSLDLKPARWVRNLNKLAVVAPQPR